MNRVRGLRVQTRLRRLLLLLSGLGSNRYPVYLRRRLVMVLLLFLLLLLEVLLPPLVFQLLLLLLRLVLLLLLLLVPRRVSLGRKGHTAVSRAGRGRRPRRRGRSRRVQ